MYTEVFSDKRTLYLHLTLKSFREKIKFTDTQVCIYETENESENDKASWGNVNIWGRWVKCA